MDPPSKKRRLAPKASPAGPPTPATQPNPQQTAVPIAAASTSAAAPLVETQAPARVEFERFARHLQDAAMLIQRSAERPPYTAVSVLLLRWEEDASTDHDLVSLEKVLRDTLGYHTERWNIPTVPNPSIKLGVQMASFLENARPDHLLIIYYTGHGYVGGDNQLYWASNSRDDAAKLKWHGVRCLFEDAQSDILLFLDTCSLRDSPLAGSHGLKQAIAAWGPEHNGREGSGRTFTSLLASSLQKFGASKNPFSVQGLYEDMLAAKQLDLAQNAEPITNGAGKPHPGSQLPIFFTLTPGKGQSITLSPLSPTGGRAQSASPRKAVEGEGEATKSSRQDQVIPPEAVHELQFDQSRVLACTTFVGEASPDMAYFHKWLEDTPAIADKVAVEAMFFGPPTMLLISMALPIWEVVRHDKVCIFLGYIGSHNFVHLYQRLVGYAGTRPSARLSAKEVEDGRILLEAREAASAKRGRHEDGHDAAPGSHTGPYSRYQGSTRVKDDGEDSAEMKEAAEQLKALSHIRHVSGETPSKPQRSSLPDSAPHPHDDSGSSNGANESGGDDSITIVDYNTPRAKQQRRSLNKTIPKHETRCTHCSHAPFKDSSSLRKHVAAAHTRPFPCAFSFAGCSSTFGSKNEWKRHISSQHLCLQYYRCSACPATASEGKFNEFNRKDLFTQHLRRMHAPFAIKKSLTKVDSKLQLEWEAHVKEMQQSCLVQRRQPPQRSACPKPDCHNIFEGPGAWDEWTEHVGRHMEKSEGGRLGVDRHLAKWALDENIIERDDSGEYRLVQDSGIGGPKNNHDQTKDSISVAAPPPETPTRRELDLHSPEEAGEGVGDGSNGSGSGGGSGDKMEVDG